MVEEKCRICWDKQEDLRDPNRLLESVCGCRGTSLFVCSQCLLKECEEQRDDPNFQYFFCKICRSRYPVREIDPNLLQWLRSADINSLKTEMKHIFEFFFYIAMIFLISLAITLIYQKKFVFGLSKIETIKFAEKLFLIILILYLGTLIKEFIKYLVIDIRRILRTSLIVNANLRPKILVIDILN